MSAIAVEARTLALLCALATTLCAGSAPAEEPWIIEATPEDPDAVAEGAEEALQASELARQKQYAQAVALLQELARDKPAAEHDCLLSLAYLRTGDLTRAQLLWDVAKLRAGKRPDWCTGNLSKELAVALRDAELVPLTLSLRPVETVLEIEGIHVRGPHTLWMPASIYAVTASAEGYRLKNTHVIVAPPGATLTLTLVPPALSQPGLSLGRRLRRDWPAFASLAGGTAAIVLGAVFHSYATDHREVAQGELAGSAAYDRAVDDFSRQRALAMTGYGIGSLAIGFGVWWLTQASSP